MRQTARSLRAEGGTRRGNSHKKRTDWAVRKSSASRGEKEAGAFREGPLPMEKGEEGQNQYGFKSRGRYD